MRNMKEVTPQQFHERFLPYRDKIYYLRLQGWEVAILHGLISLVADHPGIKAMQGPTRQAIDHVRSWCNGKFTLWGFTPEEVEYLNNMREVKAGESSSQDKERQRLDLWDRVKRKVWQMDMQDYQISHWFQKNCNLDVHLTDFDLLTPQTRIKTEHLENFLKTLERYTDRS
ncbi:MAG: hypothetical protein AAC990_04110 [Dehalococcoides mccartyi]|uniref:hypothetical protein n=1 Tax=Dehalococcoides mccartyi TaxID=61435 RepID=UPI0030F4BAC2